jgi:antitoxin CcdA
MRMKKGLSDPQKPFQQERKPVSKRSVNLSIDADVLAAAKAQGINLSAVFEKELRQLTQDECVKRFQAENKAAFESYNAYIERNGVFGAEFQDWDEPV